MNFSRMLPVALLLLALSFFSCSKDGTEPEPKKPLFPTGEEIFNPDTDKIEIVKEIRGVWLTTVSNLDWPHTKNNAEAQKAEMRTLLDNIAALRANVVVLQVRPNSDAFYPTELAPWSAFLTGTQGVDPGYDPLGFTVEETHKRGMELHAWINPLRINSTTVVQAANHPAKQHPDWVVEYKGGLYWNPGVPEFRAFLQEVVKEMVQKYEIDAVHIDDYFYPYGIRSDADPYTFNDRAAFEQYGGGKSLDAWRADNVNNMVKELYEAVKQTKSHVMFGVSPMGSVENGKALYADPSIWVAAKHMDYLVPQFYNHIGHATGGFDLLANYWQGRSSDQVTIAPGIAAYKYGDPAYPSYASLKEFRAEMDICRKPGFKGAMWFRAAHATKGALFNYIRDTIYPYYSLLPEMNDTRTAPAVPPLQLQGNELKWGAVPDADAYAVYTIIPMYTGAKTWRADLVQKGDKTTFAHPKLKRSYFVTAYKGRKESAKSQLIRINP